MTQKRKDRPGPALTTLKVVGVLVGLAAVAVMALAAIGIVVGPPQTPTPERIRAECAARFSERGEQAVEVCVIELLARAAEDDRSRLLDDAYRASRRPQ